MRRRAIALSVVAAASVAVASAAAPADLTIRLYDGVPLPAATADGMRASAEAALAPAGIRLRWLLCPDHVQACASARTGRDIVVRVLREPPPSGKSHCGFAIPVNGRGFVSLEYSCAARAAAALERRPLPGPHTPLSAADILGYTLAHEIAHVLLPGVPHSSDGIFKARLGRRDWDRIRQRRPAFNPVDVHRLRAAVAQDCTAAPLPEEPRK